MSDMHDVPAEPDQFEFLFARVKALKAGDDIGARACLKAALEADLSEERLDVLRRAVSKAGGFPLPTVKRMFVTLRTEHIARKDAERAAEPSFKAAKEAARQAAIAAARAEHEAERERLFQSVREIAVSPNLMNDMASLSRRLGVVGEVAAIKGSYIAMTSRLLKRGAISLLRRGAPAGGKNFLLNTVARLIPKESVIPITSASSTALVYFGDNEDALRHKVIIVAEAAAIAERHSGDEHPAAVMLRSLVSEGKISRIVTITRGDGPPRSKHFERDGPVALLLTTARANIDPEMFTRLLVSDADESTAQTLAVIRQNWLAKTRPSVADAEVDQWVDFQRWLEFDGPYDVAVPFDEAIVAAYEAMLKEASAPVPLRMRRDSSGLFAAIQASAVIHRAQRKTDAQGRIVAALADYGHAWSAFNQSMASLYGLRVREEIVAVAKAAESFGVDLYDEHAAHGIGGDNPSEKLTVDKVAQALGINSNNVAAHRIEEAIRAGVLLEDDSRRGQGRGRPRYFWLLRSSEALSADVGSGVLPHPDAVSERNILHRETGSDRGQNGEEGQEAAENSSRSDDGDEKKGQEGREGSSDQRGQAEASSCPSHPSRPSSPQDPVSESFFEDEDDGPRRRDPAPAFDHLPPARNISEPPKSDDDGDDDGDDREEGEI